MFLPPDLVPADPTSEQQSAYPDLPPVDNQHVVVNTHGILSPDAQEQFPTIEQVMSSGFAAPVRQAETLDTVPTTDAPAAIKTPKSRKKNPASSKSSKTKAAKGNGAQDFSLSVSQQLNVPSLGPDQYTDSDPIIASGFQPAPQQANVYTSGSNQSTVSDPFVSSGSQLSFTNNSPVQFSANIPGTVQQGSPISGQGLFNTSITARHGVGNPVVQQTGQLPIDYSMLMKQPSQASSLASLNAMASPASSSTSTSHAETPSSESKRKAASSHVMETPTKRHKSANTHGAFAASAHQTPEQNFQTPNQSTLDQLYNISPPSGSTSAYSTSVKAGVCAVVRLLVQEARKHGTALSQILTNGPATDFGAPETANRIKQMTKSHLVAVDAMGIESNQEAFINGAYKTLQTIVEEAEARGSIFGKELLLGSVSGPDLMAAKQRMASMYKEIAAAYVSSPEPAGKAKQSVQQLQTPTRAPRGPAAAVRWDSDASPPSIVNQNILGAGSAVPGPATPFPVGGGGSSSISHAVPSPPEHFTTAGAIPKLPGVAASPATTHDVFVRSHNSSSSSGSSTTTTTSLPTSVPLPTEVPKAKRKPRKPRARGSSSSPSSSSNKSNSNSNGNNKSSPPSGGAAQHVPKSLYRFDTRKFYMLLTLDGCETAHEIGGNGTAQLEQALRQFLAAAGERLGVADEAAVPGEFVFCQWEGVEGNLERLRGLLMGVGSAGLGSLAG
ncbi:hypothetical protein MFIFM68171_03563 [Madurella fahalii]|uniref:Uncharacterized protein n=1 Tax=Madurella fahalii TaxID=1157608 RepID=A0ABQ0G6G3_9PEZI